MVKKLVTPANEKSPPPTPGPPHAHSPPRARSPKPHKDSQDATHWPSRPPSLAPTDTDDEDDDYDWSAEDDLDEEEARFEGQMGQKREERGLSFRKVLSWMFSTLIGSTLLAGLLVVAPILMHFFYYNPDKSSYRRYVEDNVEAWLFWVAANLLISWYLAVIVDITPRIIRFIIAVAWGHVPERVQTRIDLYNAAKENIKPVLYGASAWLSWVVLFENIYQLYDSANTSASRASYTHRLYQAIEFFFFLTLVVCIQRIVSHMIAFSFHKSAYKERIDAVQHTLKVLETLSQYKPKPTRKSNRSSMFGLTPPLVSRRNTFDTMNDAGDADDEGLGKRRGRLRTRDNSNEEKDAASWLGAWKTGAHSREPSIEASPARRSADPYPAPTPRPLSRQDMIRNHPPPTPSTPQVSRRPTFDEANKVESGTAIPVFNVATKAIKAVALHDARGIKGKANDDGLTWKISSIHQAKRLARQLYAAFKTDKRRSYLIASDFNPAFPTVAEAEEAFRVFDTDNNGDVSRAEFKTAIVKVYKERRFLSRSLRDVGSAIKTLDSILLFFAFVILFFVSLSVFDVNVTSSLTSLYSLGIAASFVFKNAATNAFDAVLFLFVTHPFDTGDRVFIDNDNMVVKKMGLFATVFTKADGTDTYYFNSQLFLKFITNVRRSGKMGESCALTIAWETPFEKLDALEKCMNEWLQTEENRWYDPSTSVSLQQIHYQRHLDITMYISHNSNWQDWGVRCARKTAFHAAANFYCRQLGITCAEVPVPLMWSEEDLVEILGEADRKLSDDASLSSTELEREAVDCEEKRTDEARPVLGFRPPHRERTKYLRARKSNRRAALHGQGADGGHGDGGDGGN